MEAQSEENPGFNGRNISDTWGKNTKTRTEKCNVPDSVQSTWELALCAVLMLNQG
jgi:hypothetical protein